MGLFSSSKNEVILEEKKNETKGKLYCIDFENTLDSGIIGISKLKENDEVVIFYGSNNNSISFVSHEMIVLANCKVTINKCDKSAKNYLDFQLVSYVGLRLGKENFEKIVIVSRDQGYDAVVDFWKKENVEIARQEAIDPEVRTQDTATVKKEKTKQREKKSKENNKEKANTAKVAPVKTDNKKQQSNNNSQKNSLPDSFKKKIRTAVKETELKPTQYTLIYSTMLKCKTEEEYEKNIKKRMANKGNIVFEQTAGIFKEYLGKNDNK